MVFPVGWNSDEVKSICGSKSNIYNFGNCTLGWAFIIIIVGTGVALAAAIMSWTPLLKRKKDREPSYAI